MMPEASKYTKKVIQIDFVRLQIAVMYCKESNQILSSENAYFWSSISVKRQKLRHEQVTEQ